MSPRPRSVSDEAIFAATARVIARDGPAALTIGSVAAEAGLAPSSLMGRVGSKRELLLAFASGGASHARATFEGARATATTPLAAVEGALVALAGAIRSRRAMAHHLAFLQMDLSDPEFRKHALAQSEAVHGAIAALLREDGAGRAAEERAVEVQTAYNGALVLWAIHGNGTAADAVRRAVRRALRR